MAWELSDGELLERMREQDAAAFDAFYARHRLAVTAHLLRIVRDQTTADDLVQETFLRVWLHADQWDGRGTVSGWIVRIATNLALNQIRTVKRRREQSLEVPAMAGEEESFLPGWCVDAAALGPDILCEQTERHQQLQRMLDELPDEKREVVRLVHEAEMDMQEVATALDIPVGTVKSRLHHARKQLARRWKEWEES